MQLLRLPRRTGRGGVRAGTVDGLPLPVVPLGDGDSVSGDADTSSGAPWVVGASPSPYAPLPAPEPSLAPSLVPSRVSSGSVEYVLPTR